MTEHEWINKYHRIHYDLIQFLVAKGRRDKIKAFAARENKSMSAYIRDCIQEHEEKRSKGI